MNLTILAFNYGYAGSVVNGPGMCLANFVKFLKETYSDINIKVFTILKSKSFWPDIYSVSQSKELSKAIINSDVVHLWSGLNKELKDIIKFANKLKKKVIIGPNVLDTVKFSEELNFLKDIKYEKILTVNEHLRFRIAKKHSILQDLIEPFIVGPDPELWIPSNENDGTILWKGNGRQFVKDLEFGKQLEEKLKHKYEFKFIGDNRPYDYFDHIKAASSSKISIITSLSETMGLAMMESWSAGIPSVSHPKIHMHGINYQTGIITNKTIDDYIVAIDEIMENNELYSELSFGSRKFIEDNFSSNIIAEKYINILNIN